MPGMSSSKTMIGSLGGASRLACLVLFGTVLAAGAALAQMQPIPVPGAGSSDSTGQPPSPFLGSNPPSVQSQGGKSYYQNKQVTPDATVRCDAFNRIGQGFDECRSRQLNQAWDKQQQQQAGNPPANPRLQPVDPLMQTRPYR